MKREGWQQKSRKDNPRYSVEGLKEGGTGSGWELEIGKTKC